MTNWRYETIGYTNAQPISCNRIRKWRFVRFECFNPCRIKHCRSSSSSSPQPPPQPPQPPQPQPQPSSSSSSSSSSSIRDIGVGLGAVPLAPANQNPLTLHRASVRTTSNTPPPPVLTRSTLCYNSKRRSNQNRKKRRVKHAPMQSSVASS